MRKALPRFVVAAMLGAIVSGARAGTVDRLYVIDCGWAHATDQSVWSPGVNVGVPIDYSDNCYLIHHSNEGFYSGTPGLPTAWLHARTA